MGADKRLEELLSMLPPEDINSHKSVRKKVDWPAVREWTITQGPLKVSDIRNFVLETFPEKGGIEYSEVYRVLKMWAKDPHTHVTKKTIPAALDGKHQGVYWRIQEK